MRREKSFRIFFCKRKRNGKKKAKRGKGRCGFLRSKLYFYAFAVAIRTKKMVESIENEKKLLKE